MKENPYKAKTREGFNIDSLKAITELKIHNNAELLDQVIVLFGCHSGMRAIDLHNLKSDNITIVPKDDKVGRRIR